MIFYFSGTGNSEGIAQLLAKRLRDRAVDIVGKTPASYVFSPEDRVGFVFPVYAYAAPKVMLAFAAGISPGGAYTFAAPTYSNAAGCTLEHFSQTACRLDGGFGIKMPDNMPVFDKIVETRETAIEKLRAAASRFEAVVEQVRNRKSGFDIYYGPTPERLTWESGVRFLEEPSFQTTLYHVRKDRCVGCGLCEQLCPAGVIRMEGDTPVWTRENCYICMACLNRCPAGAIEYGPYSEGKYRYFFRGFDLSRY